MRRVSLIILIAFIAQAKADAKTSRSKLISNVQPSLADLADRFIERALKVPFSRHAHLDNTTFGKGEAAAGSAGGASVLKLPPSSPTYSQPFGVLRESIAYLGNPDAFVAERAKTLGPVFRAGLFFRPTVFIGGPDNVQEFIRKERVITESSLPETFNTLHTPYGLLNQAGEKHAASRRALPPLFNTAALEVYLPLIEKRTTSFVDGLKQRSTEDIAIAAELKRFYLDLFAELFTGAPLTDEEASLFVEYNSGLLSLGKWAGDYKAGEEALRKLQQIFGARLMSAKADGSLNKDPRFQAMKVMTESKEEDGSTWTDERVATAMVLFTWGAYVETAALGVKSVLAVGSQPEMVDRILTEGRSAGVLSNDGKSAALDAWRLPFANGVLRESLRLNPATGGGFRVATEPIQIGGFDIEAGTVVTADPRISSAMPELHPQPETFEPLRWVDPSSPDAGSSKCPFAGVASKLKLEAWHPGGIGAHGCPGMDLAELCSRIFLVKWVQAFESWKADSEVEYELIPIKIPRDDFKLHMAPRKS